MRLNIKTKQVLGVTSTVGAVVVALSLYHLGSLARYSLEESQARGLLLSRAIYQRAQGIAPRASDPYTALRAGRGTEVDPRIEHLLARRHLRGDRQPGRDHHGAQRSQPDRPTPPEPAKGR